MLELAKEFARFGHDGQIDKAREDYFTGHLSRVADSLDSEEEKVVAYLHDLLEDTRVSYQDLVTSFGKEIADSVRILTKKSPEIYRQYIQRIIESNNPTVIRVKLADIKDHLRDTSSLEQSMINRYWDAYKRVKRAAEKYV